MVFHIKKFIYIHLNLSLFVSIYHSIYPTYLSIYVFIYLSLYMFINISIHLSISQLIYDFVDSVMITLRKMSCHIIHYQCGKPSGGHKEYKNKFFLQRIIYCLMGKFSKQVFYSPRILIYEPILIQFYVNANIVKMQDFFLLNEV